MSHTEQTKQQHHYFATTALYWGIGATRKEAIQNVARRFTAGEISQQKKHFGGAYLWTCRVALPQGAQYAINNYMPVVNPDELSDVREFRLMNRDGYVQVED